MGKNLDSNTMSKFDIHRQPLSHAEYFLLFAWFDLLFFNVPVNNYGHVETVS